MRRITNTLREMRKISTIFVPCITDQVTVDFPFGRRAKPSLIHIHKYHDLSNGVVIFLCKGKEGRCLRKEG